MLILVDFSQWGLWGLLAAGIVAIFPFIRKLYETWKNEEREDRQYSDSAWKDFAQELRLEIRELKEELRVTQAQISSLKGELRFLRTAEEQAPVAIWELDELHRMKWFNRTFNSIIWLPTGVAGNTTYQKTWREIYGDTGLAYEMDDAKVRSTRQPVVNDELYTLDELGNRTYWHTIKWPIIDNGHYRGLKGLAYPIE